MKTAKALETLGKLEEMTVLDPVVDTVRRAVRKVLHPSTFKDLLLGVPVGHPAHQVLVQLPTGAFACTVLLDAVTGTERAARVLIATGLAAVVSAVATGLAEWSDLHPQQQRVGLVHAGANVMATGCFALSLAARFSARGGEKSGHWLGSQRSETAASWADISPSGWLKASTMSSRCRTWYLPGEPPGTARRDPGERSTPAQTGTGALGGVEGRSHCTGHLR